MNKICLKEIDLNSYYLNLARLYTDKQFEAAKLIEDFDKAILQAHGCRSSDIFHDVTGAVFLTDAEWVLSNGPLKRLFSMRQQSSFLYASVLEQGVMLRGPAVYYYNACFGGTPIIANDACLYKWRYNVDVFLSEIESICNFKSIIPIAQISSLKLLLGLLDNLRHILLESISLHLIFIAETNNKIHLHTEFYSDYLQEAFKTVVKIHTLVEHLIMNKHNEYDLGTLLKVVSIIKKCFVMGICKLESTSDIRTRSKCLKLHREADHYVENYIGLRFAANQLCPTITKDTKYTLSGILNGGLELAILLSFYVNGNCSDLCFFYVFTDYITRHTNHSVMEKDCVKINSEENIILVDDSILTGHTLQYAVNYYHFECHFNVARCVILRHPGLNRVPQMHQLKQYVNTDFLSMDCLGLLTPTPYSRLHFFRKANKEFTDEFGVFTLAGEAILKSLYKNGLFNPGSVVGTLMNRI